MARNKTARDILEAIVAGERGPKALAARAHGNRKIRNHLRQLKALGLDVTVNPTAA